MSRAPSVQSSPRRTASAAGGAGAGVIQRIQCNVTQNGKVVGSSPKVGKGGTPGVSHAEQKAWNAMSSAIAAGDIIKFHVDGPICAGCTAWFENTAYPAVHGAGATLMVNVLYNEPGNTQFYGTIEVTGPGTVWGKVSEKGYYGPTGKAESEVLRLLAKAAT